MFRTQPDVSYATGRVDHLDLNLIRPHTNSLVYAYIKEFFFIS